MFDYILSELYLCTQADNKLFFDIAIIATWNEYSAFNGM